MTRRSQLNPQTDGTYETDETAGRKSGPGRASERACTGRVTERMEKRMGMPTTLQGKPKHLGESAHYNQGGGDEPIMSETYKEPWNLT